MNKFMCTNCKDDESDNKLQLKVKETHYKTFDIKKDGQLEYYDGDCDQEVFLECPLCGAKYEFEIDEDKFVLQLEERSVATLFNIHSNGTGEGDIANLNELRFKRK